MPEKTSDIWWLFSRQTVAVSTKESVLNAAMLMKNRNFRHLPVIAESGKILGIISVQDIIDSLNLTLAVLQDGRGREVLAADPGRAHNDRPAHRGRAW